jgi:hypothetical protein
MVWFLVFYMRMRKKVSFFTPMPWCVVSELLNVFFFL